MTRFRAAGIHLIISGLIVMTLLALMFGVWYPNKYFTLMGGNGLIYLIAGIDVCLGPLLTLVVFKSGKKSLKFDLSIIVLVQLSALAYGSYTMFNVRPIFTAYADGMFSIATANEVTDAELKLGTKPEWTSRPLMGPLVVAIAKPTEKKDLESTSFLASFGLGYARFPRLFVNYELKQSEILNAAKPLSILGSFDIKNIAVIEHFLKNQQRPETDFVFVPISSAYGAMAAVLDAKNAEFITIIDAEPREPVKSKVQKN